MIRTVDDVIDALGGTGALASALGLGASTVSSWRARGSIPAERWRIIVDVAGACGAGGITFETLALLHARGRQPEAARS